MKLIGDNYKERCQSQLDYWAKGTSIHNIVDDECCPDFSCCSPDLQSDEQTRQLFKKACDQNDEDAKNAMLMGFLGACIAKASEGKTDVKVHVSGGIDAQRH